MDAIALLLSRLRFAFTISFRIPALTIGLAAWLTILEALHLTTGRAAYCVTFEFGSRYSVWHSASASSNQRSKHSHGTPIVAIHVPDLVPLPDHLGVVDRLRLVARPGAKELDGEIHHETAFCFAPV